MKMRRDGFTLLEVAIASGVLSILVLGLYTMLQGAAVTYTDASRSKTLQENSQRVMDRITGDLRTANPDTLVVGTKNGTGSLTLQTATGFTGGAATWSTTIEYYYETSPVDANNNGIVDEGRLIRRQDGVSLRLCDGIRPGGFIVTQTGTRIALTLNTLTADERNNHELRSSVTTTIVVRNRTSS